MTDKEEITFDLKTLHAPGRYAVSKEGYVFDRYLFRILSVIVIILMAVTFFQLGGFGAQYAYASCPEDAIGGRCHNPLFGMCDLPACQQEILFPGEAIGTKAPSIAAPLFFVFLAASIVFFVNHLSQENKQYVEARNERNNYRRTK